MYMHVASDMHPRVHCLRPYYAPPDKQVGVQKYFSALRANIILLHPHSKYTSYASVYTCIMHDAVILSNITYSQFCNKQSRKIKIQMYALKKTLLLGLGSKR